jgi:hypothetical protein
MASTLTVRKSKRPYAPAKVLCDFLSRSRSDAQIFDALQWYRTPPNNTDYTTFTEE